jgi:ABC-type transport system substrate-binding protein
MYQRLHEILAREQPYTWLVQPSSRWAVSKRIRNVQIAPGLGLFYWIPGPRAWWIPADQQGAGREGSGGRQ